MSRLKQLLNNPKTAVVAVGASCLLNGVVGGYILGRRSVAKELEALKDSDDGEHESPHAPKFSVEDPSKNHPSNEDFEPKVIPFDRPTKIVLTEEEAKAKFEEPVPEEIEEVVEEYQGTSPEPGFAVESVFDSPYPEWSYEAEEANRGDVDPYVIHQDEFHSEESGFRQSALLWYAGDGVMTDEDDAPVPNYSEITGELKFGYGSNDSDIVFVRNPRLEAEYEIIRSYDSYMHAVLGFEADEAADEELRHSMHRIQRRWDG